MEKEEEGDLEWQSSEKNELLNNTEIKMKDFESIDSDDDFLEDENEVCSTGKCSCIRKRTCTEKVFFALLIIAFCVILGLIIKSSSKSEGKANDSICQTKGCVDVANNVLKSIDKTVNPCTDFYKYACGSWEEHTPIPPGFSYWDRTQELAYKNMFQLHQLLESYHGVNAAVEKSKKFHDSCMNEEKVEKGDVINKIKNLIKSMPGTENNFTLVVLLENIHRLNSWPLFTVSVGPDEQDDDNSIIKISHSDMPYPIEVFVEKNQTSSQTSTSKYLKWDAEEVKQKYLGDMSRILTIFWNKTEEEADNIANDLLRLDIEIAKTKSTDVYEFHRAKNYNKTSVSSFQQKCGMLEWESYLTGLTYDMAEIKNTDIIAVLHEDSLQKLCNIIKVYEDSKENRTVLYYYLLVHAVHSLMPYFEPSSFQDVSDPKELSELNGELWQRCTFYTNKAFGFATAAMYINSTSQHNDVAQIEQLVQNVKGAFKDFVLRKVWFQGDIRQKASKKIDQMLEKISYPSYILQPKVIEEFYNKVEVGSDWFQNLINWNKFDVSNMFKDLGKQTDKKSWIKPPFSVESDYDPVRNELNFPTAMLHMPFYTDDGPETLNYGALAAVIGHEITHAFDIVGKQYNYKGKLENWWDSLTVSSFNKTVNCMKDQYDSYKLDGQPINGYQTLDENIADNGGLRAAFFAYQLWERKGVEIKKLPGVNLSSRQLFFVSYAQMFCSKWKPDGLKKHIINDKHSPGPIRVRGAISNMNTFGDEFDCPFITNYNPNSKCEVW